MEEATYLPHAWQRVFNSVGVDELEATKYNPNHDSRGRFSGGGSGRVASKVKRSRAKVNAEITAELLRLHGGGLGAHGRVSLGRSKVAKVAKVAKVKKAASGGGSRTVELLPTDGKTMRSALYPAGVGVKLTPQGKTYEIQSFREAGSSATILRKIITGDATRRSENVQLNGMIAKTEGWRTSANGRDLTAAKWIARAALEERVEFNHSRSVGFVSSGGHVDLIIARQKSQVSMDTTISGVIAVSTRGGKIYVDYLATNPTASGTGVGSHLLRAAAIQGVQLGMNGLKLQALSTASTYYRRTMGMTPNPRSPDIFTWTKAQMTRFAKTGKLPTGVTLKYYEELKLGGDYGRMAKEPTQLDAMEEAYSQEPADGAFVSKREVFSPRQVFAPKRIMLDYARTRTKALVNDEEEDTDYFDELGNEIKYNAKGET